MGRSGTQVSLLPTGKRPKAARSEPQASGEGNAPRLEATSWLCPEGFAAAAGGLRVRVHHLEAALLERVDVVERGAHEVEGALLVDDDADRPRLDRRVAFALAVVEGELVAQAGAASADHLQAERVRGELAFLREQIADATRGGLGDLDERHGIPCLRP